MRNAWFFLLCVFVLVNSCSIIERVKTKQPTVSWSSSEPLSVPFSVRQNQFEKGNLVVNPSFEDGSSGGDVAEPVDRIIGWEIVGRNVQWIDSQSSGFTPEDVHSGRHAVRIIRKTVGELDESEGIVSDYINVIPGNYTFSYNVKLKYITSNKSRLGVRLYDAVEIKVLFFDEDKQPIEPGILNPVTRSQIDNSNKGYSFSNFWEIDDFPWAEVRGRTYNYPFSEGDIPDRARYVRLFFGLKGRGIMWVDDIVYRYSKWNFTPLERFKPYFDRPLELAERIIPTPKSMQKVKEIFYYDPTISKSHLPAIVIPENAAPAELTAAELLREKIGRTLSRLLSPRELNDDNLRIFEDDYSMEEILSAKLVFSIGRNPLYETIKPQLPLSAVHGKPQGYVIKSAQMASTHIVFLIGETPLACYYAATTAVQLFEADRAVYHDTTVVDYPDFLGRSYVFKDWQNAAELQTDLQALQRLSQYKLNKVYLGYNRPGDKWDQADALYRKGIREAGRLCRESGVMSLGMMVNPYAHLGFETSSEKIDDQLKYRWTHGDPKSLEMLKDLYRLGLDAGAETIMLLADDSVPHSGDNRQNYTLYTIEDKKRFVALQNAQAHVLNYLKRWIDTEYPGTRLEFCPPWYSNEHIDRSQGKAENYFRDLIFQIPQDVAIIWTGPTIRSLSIDMADLHRYKKLIGRWPMTWDNTLYARNLESPNYGGYPAHYPGKVRLCSLFEPFDTYRPKAFQKFSHGRHMYTNGAAFTEVYKMKYATVADYEWNTEAYNPEMALWKVLVGNYGQSVAEQLIRFNDAYYGFYEIYLRLKSDGAESDQDLNNAELDLTRMREYIHNISAELSQQTRLIGELEDYLEQHKRRLDEIQEALE
jgi:hypothetical protein